MNGLVFVSIEDSEINQVILINMLKTVPRKINLMCFYKHYFPRKFIRRKTEKQNLKVVVGCGSFARGYSPETTRVSLPAPK
jgi:hypothetical protein